MNSGIDNPKPKKSNQNYLLGILIIGAGILLLLKNLNLLPYSIYHLIFSWPSLLIFIGIFSLKGRNAYWGYLLIGLGLFFHLSSYWDLGRYFWDVFWPGLIIAVGVFFLYGLNKKKKNQEFGNFTESHSTESALDEVVIFGGTDRRISGQNFSGGSATCLMSGLKLDLSQAEIEADAALMELNLIFSDAKIRLPAHWDVRFEAVNIFGGFNDKRAPYNGSEVRKKLIISGSAIFSGVEILDF